MGMFATLSLLAVGGGNTIVPEIKRLAIDQYHWLSERQFLDVYSLGQITPGPTSLYVTLIGYRVAGVLGGVVAVAALYLPAALVALAANRLWDRLAGTAWQPALHDGLAPVTVGLMLAATYSLGRTAISGPTTAVVMAAVAGLLLWRRLNPALVVLGAGIACWLLGLW